MEKVSDRITAVLDARKIQIPVIERENTYWNNVLNLLSDLERAVSELREASIEDGIIAEVAELDVPGLRQVAANILAVLTTVRARVGRRTINIGVSGRARNGKSTLLQSLTGLDDRQIPTGQGQPVTAVRSTIYHSLTRSEALLTMHTGTSFCEEVVAPYHDVLQLPAPPHDVDDFAASRYPATASQLPGGAESHPKSGPMLARLREMQQSLPTYRDYLTGTPRRVELADLRSWVAYPAAGDDAGGRIPDRQYLAVRDADVMCTFPIDDVIDLGLVDLPGLGELVPRAEEHHLRGLVNDVDFVLVVKRPTDTNALWSTEDGQALKLITRASGAAKMRDFMVILVNSGGCDDVNVDALHDDLRDRLNEGTDGQFYRVITADAADRDAVRDHVLRDVLAHLADALPRMDAAAIEHALALSTAGREQLLAITDRLLAALRRVITPTPVQDLIMRSQALRTEVATSLQEWVERLHERAEEGYEDEEFYRRAAEVQSAVRDWILDGFGEGQDAWTTRALGEMRLHRSSASFAEHALNSIRVEIARRFSAIDDLLLRRRAQFWAELGAALGPRLGQLLESDDPEQALAGLAERLLEAPDPCPALADSLNLVLDVRLDYRTRVLPQVRRALEVLLPHPGQGRAGELASLLDAPLTEQGAKEIYTAISDMARQAVHDGGTVLAQEPGTTALVLFAYGEQFEDTFIRSEEAEAEFLRLSDAFRDQLWPAEGTGPAAATARVQRTRKALTQLKHALDGMTVTGAGDHNE